MMISSAKLTGVVPVTPLHLAPLQADATPGARDAEELIEVQRYALAELQALMVSGHMLLPSVATCFMALEKLKNLGHLP